MCSAALALALALSLSLGACGVPRATVESALTAAVGRYPAVAAQVCGHASPGLAAISVDDLDYAGVVRAEVPETASEVFELGTGTASIAGYDAEGTRCAGRLAFTYRAAHGAGRRAQSWHVVGLGPLVSTADARGAPPTTQPTAVTDGVATHELTSAPPWEVTLALEARAPVTLYLRPADDRAVPADFYSLQVLRHGEALFDRERTGDRIVRVLVAPVAGVYTLRVTAASPVPTRLQVRAGYPDGMAP